MGKSKLAAELIRRATKGSAKGGGSKPPVPGATWDSKSKRWKGPDGKFVSASKGNNKPKNGTKPKGNTGTVKSDSRSKFKVVNRHADYKMTHGKEIERTKQAAAIAGAISSSTGTSAVSDWHAQEEETKRTQIRADASKSNAKELADAMKNRTYNENKHYVIEGLGSLQQGGSTKTVNPAEEDPKYSV